MGPGARRPRYGCPEGGPTCKASGIPPWPGGSGGSHAGHWAQAHNREPPGRGHHAAAPPLWRLSRHRGEPWISAPSWWQHDRAATMHRRDRRGRCAGIGPLGDEVAAERVARCQPLGTPASDGQGAPVRFARVRFAASRFARARPPAVLADPAPSYDRSLDIGARWPPGVSVPGSFGRGQRRRPELERDLPGPAPRPSTEFPAAGGGESMERGAVCPLRRRVHGGQDDVPARPQGVERPKSRLPRGCCEARPGLPMECL